MTKLPRTRTQGLTVPVLYLFALLGMTVAAFLSPKYGGDEIAYVGCMEALKNTDCNVIHARAYSELAKHVSRQDFAALTAAGTQGQRDKKAHDARFFCSFLTYYNIRPLYLLTAEALTKAGANPYLALRIISATSYLVIGVVVFAWISAYARPWLAAIGSLLLMSSQPVLFIGRQTVPDGFAAATVIAGLYLLFERRHLFIGILLLLISIFIRTDAVLMAAAGVALLWLRRADGFGLKLPYVATLIAVACGSVLFINHLAGNSGMEHLFASTFVNFSIPPDQPVHLTKLEVLGFYANGLRNFRSGFGVPFVILAVIALQFHKSQIRNVVAAAVVALVLHFALYPSAVDRYFVTQYVIFGIGAVAFAGQRTSPRNTRDRVTLAYESTSSVGDRAAVRAS
jgi:hypothetical protein